MSSGGGCIRGNGAVAAAVIPAGSRKMVQSLKEIVNLPDQEIYVTLKDCGMDPNETVQRLLSQDPFHEVKSKRDKKKEVKELPESRIRPNNNTPGRAVHFSCDRGMQPSLSMSSSNGFGGNRGKALQKKEDGICNILSSTNRGSNFDSNRTLTFMSGNVSTENPFGGVTVISDGSSMHSQSCPGYQHGWTGMPGQFSMADIVKMGTLQGKLSKSSPAAGNAFSVPHQFTSDMSKPDAYSGTHDLSPKLDQGIQSSQFPHLQAEDNTFEPIATGNKHVTHDSWPSATQPNPETTSAFPDTSEFATTYADISKSALVDDEIQHQNLHDETPESMLSIKSNASLEQSIGSEYLSEKEIDEHTSEVEEVNAEISLVTNLQDISLENEGLSGTTLEENPAVIIPKHLQVTSANCSHLSFGSFCSRVSTTLPGSSLQPKLQYSNPEVIKVVDYVPPLDHSNIGNSNYYDNDDIKSQRNEVAVSRGGMNATNYEISSVSEPNVSRDKAMSCTHEHQYNLPSFSSYEASTTTQPSSTAFAHPHTNLQLHSLSSLSNLMQPYSGPLPNSLLASTLPLRQLDLPFSSFLTTQSVSTKHNAVTSTSGSTVPVQEEKPNVFSNLQPQASQSSPSTNIPSGHAIPQHLPLHPYSQGTLPLGPFANVISYPFLPQSYTYMPSSAFPQAYTSSDLFHQSPSPMHTTILKYPTQYKNSLSQPAAVAAGYGNFSGSTNIPGNFSLNPPTTSTSPNLGFNEALTAQYKEGTHFLPLQQNESSPMWVHGGGSRTISSLLPPNTFYGFQGQNQLSSFRQAQQPSQYGQMGYLNFFQNQLGGQSQEQQQSSGESNLNGPQANQSQQSHQIWQHGY